MGRYLYRLKEISKLKSGTNLVFLGYRKRGRFTHNREEADALYLRFDDGSVVRFSTEDGPLPCVGASYREGK